MAPKILCSINGNPQLMLRTSTANSGITPWYCCNVMKKHFNKELAMTKTDDQDFENSTKCWIYDIRPFIIIRSSSKWRQKMKRGMRWLFDYLVKFYFIYFLFHVEELSFCFQFFSFNCNFDFFYQWLQIIKQNAVLFTKNLRCGRVMMKEWLIMSGLMLMAMLK